MCRVNRRQYRGGMRQARERRILPLLNIALGSASELEYHFLLARDLSLLGEESYQDLNNRVVEVKRMLASLACKVEIDRRAG
jgi:four helix bundle protein